jgi:biotin carboxylase
MHCVCDGVTCAADALWWQVLALKELSIRGDIRTTTEYLVDLLESSEYASNTFNTR